MARAETDPVRKLNKSITSHPHHYHSKTRKINLTEHNSLQINYDILDKFLLTQHAKRKTICGLFAREMRLNAPPAFPPPYAPTPSILTLIISTGNKVSLLIYTFEGKLDNGKGK